MSEITADKVKALLKGITQGGWSRGRTLLTNQTQRWSKEQFERNDRFEGQQIFSDFSALDDGKSRKFVCTTSESQNIDGNADFIASAPDIARAYLAKCEEVDDLRKDQQIKFDLIMQHGQKNQRLQSIIDGQRSDLQDVIDIQCSNGNWDYDPYMLGMANGLICALSILTGDEPKYLSKPDEWLKDRPSTLTATCEENLQVGNEALALTQQQTGGAV